MAMTGAECGGDVVRRTTVVVVMAMAVPGGGRVEAGHRDETRRAETRRGCGR